MRNVLYGALRARMQVLYRTLVQLWPVHLRPKAFAKTLCGGVLYAVQSPAPKMASISNHKERSLHPLQIDKALSQVLSSVPFRGSKQCQTLIKYLVEHSLGDDEILKERTVGIEVFGRPADYNTAEDPIVRARVGEVRKRLAQYYQSPEAKSCVVQIVIPSGCYRPQFVFHPDIENGSEEGPVAQQTDILSSGAVEDRTSHEAAASTAIAAAKPRWRVRGLAAAAASAALFVAWIGAQRWTKSDLETFWEPILDSKRPVVVYAGTAPVYVRSMANFYREMSHLKPGDEKQPAPRWSIPPLTEGQALTADDVLVDETGYVEIGDVTAAVSVTGLLNGRRQSFDLRMGPDLAFEDLHGVPTVLLGSYANFWTMAMSSDLRFYFDSALNIRERGGQGRVWSISHGPSRAKSSTIPEDYAMVYRLVDSKTGTPVIALAGTTTCGTRAVADFVTDPVRMRKPQSISRDAWKRKNLALIFHTSLIHCNPTSVDIVAMQSW